MKRFLLILSSALLVLSCQKEVYHNITVSVNPAEGGSVSPVSGPVLDGTSVSFKATPKGDYVFTGWSGSISGTENPKTVAITQDMNVTANFSLRSYPLTITIEGDGTVAEKVISTKSEYQSGTVVELTANPSDHWLFDHWEGDLEGNENPAQITVSTARNVKAVFVEKTYPLTVEIIGKGTVKEEVIDTKSSYQEGTTVKLTAVPDEYWQFDHWEGVVDSLTNPITLTVTNQISLNAVFVECDPGIVFTETEYVDPKSFVSRMGLGMECFSFLAGMSIIPDFDWEVDKSPDDYDCASPEWFKKMRKAGFKSMRFQMTFVGKFGPAPDYKITEWWLDRIEKYVDMCEDAGLNVILSYSSHDCNVMEKRAPDDDMYWQNLKYAVDNPQINIKIKEHLSQTWKQIARRFKDRGDFLYFESFNEPGDDWDWDPLEVEWSVNHKRRQLDLLNEWNQVFVDAVRSTGGENATRWLLLKSLGASPCLTLKALEIPHDYVSNNRLIVGVHFYEPYDFINKYAEEWGHTSSVANEIVNIVDEKFICNLFGNLKSTFIDNGIPVFIDEWGFLNKNTERGVKFLSYYAEYVCKAAKEYCMPIFFHDDGVHHESNDDGAFFDHETGEFLHSGAKIFPLMLNAVYNDDPDYTLQSVYDKAPFAEEVDTSKVVFSDTEFERYIMNEYDINHDNDISRGELLMIQEINVNTDNIKSLLGIERMPNLKKVRASGSSKGNGKLTNIDFSNNHHLEEICLNYNAISEINLQGCSKLRVLECWENNLRSLDVSSCASLEELYCAQNNIEVIDFSNNPNLEILAINDNKFSSIDLSNNVLLRILECGGNKFTTIDVSRNASLKSLITACCPNLSTIYFAESQEIESIEKDSHTGFAYHPWLAIGDPAFEEYLLMNFDTNHDDVLSLEEAEKIQDISLASNNVRTIVAIKYMKSLRSLVINGADGNKGPLQEIDLSNNPDIENLSFFTNSVRKLDIKGCNNLKSILCWGNNLSEIDLSDCPELETLLCAQNYFTNIDISQCPKLKSFCPNDCKLTELDLSNNLALEEVEIQGNPDLDYVYLKQGQTITHFIKGFNTEIIYK